MIELTLNQKNIIRELNHKIYSVEYLEGFINNNDDANIVAKFIAAGCLGFYSAVQQIEKSRFDANGIDIK